MHFDWIKDKERGRCKLVSSLSVLVSAIVKKSHRADVNCLDLNKKHICAFRALDSPLQVVCVCNLLCTLCLLIFKGNRVFVTIRVSGEGNAIGRVRRSSICVCYIC